MRSRNPDDGDDAARRAPAPRAAALDVRERCAMLAARSHVARGRIPLWVKVGWTAWLLVWAPAYWRHYGPGNFLWFCDMANFIIGAGLWLESPLLFSLQALSVGLAQGLFTLDFLWRLALGRHITGGAEYMFDPVHPLFIRALSLFHVAVPPLLAWAIIRVGYDRRALLVQTLVAWVILPLSLVLGPERDVNWVYGPYERVQAWMSPGLWFGLCMVGFPLILYLPMHLVLVRWAPPARGRAS